MGSYFQPELRAADYEALLRIVQAALGSTDTTAWLQVVAELVLGDLFHADVFAAADVRLSKPLLVPPQRGSAGTLSMVRPSWAEARVPSGSVIHRALLEHHPMTDHFFGPNAHEVVRVSDLVSPLTWRQMGGYATLKELVGATHHLGAPVVTSSTRVIAISAIRSGGDFSEREVALARRLQPILLAGYRHIEVTGTQSSSRTPAELSVVDQVAAELHITERERVVLALLAQGLTARAIAGRLAVSVRTVSKHQGNLYRKLGVADRLTAVLRARWLGLLESPDGIGW